MFGNLVLLTVPAVTGVVGVLCGKFRRKAFFCAFFAITVFLITGIGGITGFGQNGAEGIRLQLLYMLSGNLSFGSTAAVESPPAYFFLIKLFTLVGLDMNGAVMIIAGFNALLAALFIYFRCSSPYIGAIVFSAGFMLTAFIGQCPFAAMIICAFAAGHAEDRRYFRAAAAILAAACFDSSVILVFAFYLIAVIPNIYISTLVSAAAAAAAAYIPNVPDIIFSFFGSGTSAAHNSSVVCVVYAFIGTFICVLLYAMIKNRSERLVCHIPVMCGGTVMLLASISDGRFFVPAAAMLMQSAVILAPDVYAIGKRFTEIVFKKTKETSALVFTIVCSVAVYILYAYMIFSDVCGSGYFSNVLFGEGSLI